jgi:long-chain acyl-CoA synthetase
MTNQEIERELILTDCRALIVLDKLLDKVSGISVDLIIAEATYFTPIHLRSLSRLRSWNKDNHKDVIRFEELLNNPILNNRIQIDPKQDIAIIMFTSGTTGIPKGVMLTHYNQTTNALQAYHWLRGWGYSAKPQLKGWPVILCAIPFFHSYGLVVMNEAISFGCSLVLIPNPTAEAMIKAIDKHAVTHFPLIPKFVKEILKHADISKYNLSSLTTCASGGAHIEPNVMKEFEKITGARMYQGYGLTEAGPSVTATPIEGKPKYASAGLCYPDTEVKIVDLQLGEIERPPGKEGEIIVKGPQIMKGFWKDPELTSKVIKDGWLFTGDIGFLDEEGSLFVIGRKGERIISEGHTVWPKEVEDVIQSHPSVDIAVAIGVPDPLRCSTDIQVLVKTKNVHEQLENELLDYCKERLEYYMIPTKIIFKESLPMTPMGKVDRKKIVDEIEEKVRSFTNISKT